MNSKKILEDIFKKNKIKWEIKDFDSYIDPKCKTSKSIYSKLIRLYYLNNKTDFTVYNSEIKDLVRMTVIVEYNEMIPIIKKLKQTFPDLTGYLKIKNSGYRGIHLNLKVDGIPCEIQLTPKIVVMAIDYLHTLHEKWRDFDSTREIELLNEKEQEILKENNIQDKNEMIKLLEQEKNSLQNKIKEEKIDFELRKRTYYDVFYAAKLFLYQEEIEKTIKELNETKKENSSINNIALLNIFNTNLVCNGNLDLEKVKKVSEQLSNKLEDTQVKFVNLVKECLELN